MLLESALNFIWHFTGENAGSIPTERDYLRSLHHPIGLWFWSTCLQLELETTHPDISVTSIWVDHTPQCWFGKVNGAWGKPSCELADLLIVVWDNSRRETGKALLVQAKRGKSYNYIPISGSSTKKELKVLGQAPNFLLSNQQSVALGTSPKPINSSVCCEFRLASYRGSPLRHCTFLQIRDPRSSRWSTVPVSPWQTMWPPNRHRKSYSNVIKGMLSGARGSIGKSFQLGNMANDWDRLVTILVYETIHAAGGTAGGALQNTILGVRGRAEYCTDVELDWALPPTDYPAGEGPGGGIPAIFISKDEER